MGTPIAVLGGGSWGTALAIQFARSGHPTRLWARDARQRAEMAAGRRNARYLPEAAFPASLVVADSLSQAISGVRDVLIVVPSHAFRDALSELAPCLGADARVVELPTWWQ